MKKILNIAGGKELPLNLSLESPYFLLNLDRMYFDSITPSDFENQIKTWESTGTYSKTIFLNYDIQEFLERTTIKFDLITIYRYLEHVPMRDLLYFIYLISTITKKGSMVDIIVPNFNRLASMLLQENVEDENYESNNIIITTELLNEPSDPHASVWNHGRAKYYWELEGRFAVNHVEESFTFDGRDVYLRFLAMRK
jgi:hypothetical protein